MKAVYCTFSSMKLPQNYQLLFPCICNYYCTVPLWQDPYYEAFHVIFIISYMGSFTSGVIEALLTSMQLNTLVLFIRLLSLFCRFQWPAAPSKAWVCGRSLAGILGCYPGEGILVWLLWMFVLWGRGLCFGLITRPEESCRVWCVMPRQWGRSGPLRAAGPREEGIIATVLSRRCWKVLEKRAAFISTGTMKMVIAFSFEIFVTA